MAWLRRIATRVGYRYWANQARESQARAIYAEITRGEAAAVVGKNVTCVPRGCCLLGMWPCDRLNRRGLLFGMKRRLGRCERSWVCWAL